MRQALITGATSLVGHHLAETLTRKNIATRALVQHGDPEYTALKKKGIDVQSGDIREEKIADRALDGIDFVFNCVGSTAEWMPFSEWSNLVVEGTRNICRACAKQNVTRFVHLSSADVFGYHPKQTVSETTKKREWNEPYPDSKIETEEIVWLYQKEQRLPVTVIYPCKVYGELDYGFIASLSIMIQDSSLRFWRKNARFFPLYVGNLVDFMITAAENEHANGQSYLVHDGRPKSLEYFTDQISKAVNLPPVSQRVSYLRAIMSARLVENLSRFSRSETRSVNSTYLIKSFAKATDYSMKKARTELNWQPKISTKDGITRTVKWLKTMPFERLKDLRKPILF